MGNIFNIPKTEIIADILHDLKTQHEKWDMNLNTKTTGMSVQGKY